MTQSSRLLWTLLSRERIHLKTLLLYTHRVTMYNIVYNLCVLVTYVDIVQISDARLIIIIFLFLNKFIKKAMFFQTHRASPQHEKQPMSESEAKIVNCKFASQDSRSSQKFQFKLMPCLGIYTPSEYIDLNLIYSSESLELGHSPFVPLWKGFSLTVPANMHQFAQFSCLLKWLLKKYGFRTTTNVPRKKLSSTLGTLGSSLNY